MGAYLFISNHITLKFYQLHCLVAESTMPPASSCYITYKLYGNNQHHTNIVTLQLCNDNQTQSRKYWDQTLTQYNPKYSWSGQRFHPDQYPCFYLNDALRNHFFFFFFLHLSRALKAPQTIGLTYNSS